MSDGNRILVAGAGSGVGLEVVRVLRAGGRPVTGLIRNPDYEERLQSFGAETVRGDAFDPDATRIAVGASDADAIVCTLGGKPEDGRRIDHVGVENLIAAAKAAGIARFVLVTSFGCGDSRIAVPPPLLEKIGAALSEKDKAEESLRSSDLAYTILRPGGLSDGPSTGCGVLTDSNDVLGGITRADVAIGVVDCLDSDKSVGQTLGLIDRDQVRAGTLREVTLG